MRINLIGEQNKKYRNSFKSTRTDKNEVFTLADGTKAISDNKKINITNSIKNLATNPNQENIEFLLYVAENLAYGQKGNSEFKEALDKDGITPSERENTDWSEILKTNILEAIEGAYGEDYVGDLIANYFDLYSEKSKLTENQAKILELRKDITNKIINEDIIKNEENLAQSGRIRKNLDYFVASSEISETEKKECLEKFSHLLSDEYDINDQLKDKKLQVVDEMLNDMVIKTPENKVLTIKEVDQRYSGICAAISICRKAIAYEDKSKYMDIVMSELSNSKTMEIYDITDLESQKKVEIEKAEIDYNSALKKGYRIIDSSAHIWMQNAHACGDGTIQTEKYTAFDDETYGIYDDSSWFEGLDNNISPYKEFLKAIIKEKELIERLGKRRKENNDFVQNISDIKTKLNKDLSKQTALLDKTINEVFNDQNKSEKIRKFLLAYYNDTKADGEKNIVSQQSKETKESIIINFIEKLTGKMSETEHTKLEENAKQILSSTEEISKINNKIKKLKPQGTPAGKYKLNKLLYQTAAAHRIALETDVNLHDGVIRYQSELNLQPQDKSAVNHLKSIQNRLDSEDVRKSFADENGTIPEKEKLESELSADIIKLESIIPNKIDNILKSLLGYTINDELTMILNIIEKNIEENDRATIDRTSILMGCKNEKTETLKKVENCKKKLENTEINSEEVQDVIRKIGYESRIQLANFLIGSFFETLKSGISMDVYQELQKKFQTDDIDQAIRNISNQYEQIVNEYNEIYEKWNIPSSRENILKTMEKKKYVLSRKELNTLKKRFDSIQEGIVKNEKTIENAQQREKENNKLFKFSEEESNILKKVNDNYSAIKKYNKIKYNNLNSLLKPELEEQYAYIGMLNGQFWVREEGSTGLSSMEQIRILEQMTGKPYHIEYDIKDAAKQIKEGNGSGIISTSVDHNDYAFHAQYAPSVTEETFVNPKTGEIEKKDILWTDNSWGKSEREYFWDGKDGFKYTDYGRKYGWKNGFITDDSYKIGLPVNEIDTAVGHSNEYDEDFGLFSDIILPGTPVNIYQKLNKLFSYITTMDNPQQNLNSLETALNNGYKISPDKLNKLDDVASIKIDKLMNATKEIKSESDFNKLDNNDELKLTFNKLSAYMATDNPVLRENILCVTNNSELNEVKKDMNGEHANVFLVILGKSQDNVDAIEESVAYKLEDISNEIKQKHNIEISEEQQDEIIENIFDNPTELQKLSGALSDLEKYLLNKTVDVVVEKAENEEVAKVLIEGIQKGISEYIDSEIRIKDLNSRALTLSPLQSEFIKSIDKYLNPKDNTELLQLIQGLQECDNKKVMEFLNVLQEEDVRLNYKSAYEYIEKLKADNAEVYKAFTEIVTSNEIGKYLNTSAEGENETPEELYRDLYVKLTDMDVQKFIKNFKAEAFEKYKARQAFPEPVVLDDDKIAENVDDFIAKLFEQVGNVNDSIYSVNLIQKAHKLYDDVKEKSFYNDIKHYHNITKSEHKDDLESFLDDLENLYEITKNDTSLEDIPNNIQLLINNIKSEDEVLNGKEITKLLNKIYEKLEKFGLNITTEEELINTKNENIKSVKRNIQLYANSSINPQYRDVIIGKMNNIVKSFCKNEDNPQAEKIQKQIEELKQLVIDKHITKCPTLLLKDFVKLAQDPNRDENTYLILKQYLSTTLNVAQQTKIQYKLVQNQHEGISSKIKEMLPLLKLNYSNGTTEDLSSENGILYLVNELENTKDGNKILNLFLSQSGLEKEAIKATINSYDFELAIEKYDEQAELIKTYTKDVILVQNLIQEFLSKSNFQYRSFQDALNNLAKYIERKTKHIEDSTVIYTVLKDIKETKITDEQAVIKKKMYNSVMEVILNGILEGISNSINSQIEFMRGIPNLLMERYDLIQSINIKPDEETQEIINNFEAKYNETLNHMEEVWNDVAIVINNICE